MSPVPDPETYWLEYSEFLWEFYIRRGEKGRTKHTLRNFDNYGTARRHAIDVATADKRGAVLYIYPRGKAREVHRFIAHPCRSPASPPLNSPAVVNRPGMVHLLDDAWRVSRETELLAAGASVTVTAPFTLKARLLDENAIPAGAVEDTRQWSVLLDVQRP